jgi:hypothetical protein
MCLRLRILSNPLKLKYLCIKFHLKDKSEHFIDFQYKTKNKNQDDL